jgi:hypothetical protein
VLVVSVDVTGALVIVLLTPVEAVVIWEVVVVTALVTVELRPVDAVVIENVVVVGGLMANVQLAHTAELFMQLPEALSNCAASSVHVTADG